MITIAADTHLRTTTFSVRNEKGERIMRQRVNNEPTALLEFVRRFNGPKQYSMEASYHWPLFHNLLKDEVESFYLLHPKKLKAIIESQSKNDNYDADTLSYLTYIGYMPESYKAEPDTQTIRRFLRTRVHIAREIAAVKNRIYAIFNSYIFYYQRPTHFKDLFCKRGIAYLQTVEFPQQTRVLIDHLLKEMAALQEAKHSLENEIQKADFKKPQAALLSTVPGMRRSIIIRYIILAEIDIIDRFPSARSLVAYAGLVPRDRSSGDKIRKGKLRTDANEFLKWACLEAVYPAILADKGLKSYYKETKQRTNSSSARIATARKLLSAVYHVLKENRPYYPLTAASSSHMSFAE